MKKVRRSITALCNFFRLFLKKFCARNGSFPSETSGNWLKLLKNPVPYRKGLD